MPRKLFGLIGGVTAAAASADEALLRQIAQQRDSDPLIGAKIGGREITQQLFTKMNSERGVPEMTDLVAVDTPDDRRYFFGDAINHPLSEAQYSINDAFEKAMKTGIDGGSHLDRLIMEVMISLYKIPREVENYIAIPAGYATCINDFSAMLESSEIYNSQPSFKGIIFDGSTKDMMLSFMSVSLAFRGEDKVDMVNFYQHGSAFSLQLGKLKAQFGVWIKAAIVLIVLWGIGYTVDTILKSRISHKLDAQVKKQFATLMPPGSPMVDPVIQLEQRLNNLNSDYGTGAGAGESPLTVMRELSEKISVRSEYG